MKHVRYILLIIFSFVGIFFFAQRNFVYAYPPFNCVGPGCCDNGAGDAIFNTSGNCNVDCANIGMSCAYSGGYNGQFLDCCVANQPPPPPPTCNTGTWCGSCNFTEPPNACGTVAGSQYCEDDSYSGGGSCTPYGWYQTCYGSYNNCYGGYWCSGGQCITYCSQGAINCTQCGGGSEPTNTCGTTNGNQTCTHDAPQTCQDSNFNQGCSYFYNNCSNNYTCVNNNVCTTNIYVHVFKDYNHDGINNNGDNGFGGVTINDGGGNNIQTDGNGNVTFTNKVSGNYTITADVPAQYQSTTTDPYNLNLNSGNGNPTINFGMTPLFSISGTVFYDLNEDGKMDNGESGIQEGTLKINGNNISINNNGTYSDNNLLSGNYTVSYTPANGYQTIYPQKDFVVTVGTPGESPACNDGNYNSASCDGWGDVQNLNIATTPLHTIKGVVYNDINENFYYDNPPDTAYTGGGTVTLSGQGNGTANLSTTDGSYTFSNLYSGQYTLTYTPPTNYHAVYPVPPQFTVTVGGAGSGSPQPCDANNYHNASCNGTGDIIGLDYGISNANQWSQGSCTDFRNDGTNGSGGTGFTDIIPSSANCGGTATSYATIINGGSVYTPPVSTCTTAGVVFTGNTDANFGEGYANTNNWVIGGNTYGEMFTPRIQGVNAASYESLTADINRTGATTYNLSSYCSLTDCTLPSNLPDGIFQANGNVTLNAYTFPVSTQSQIHSYIFQINGTLTINGNIISPAGTVDMFVTTGNITVSPSVGESNTTSTNGDIEGIFVTDQSFIIASSYGPGQHCDVTTGNPKDLKLNIQGVIIVNAGNTGGSVQVQRDLCNQNRSCPTLTIGERADMLLSLPQIVRNQNSLFQETAP